MRAFEVRPPYTVDSLGLSIRDERVLEEDQIRVRVLSVALNYRDLLVIRGEGRWRPPAGRVPCSDACVEVLEVGPGVTHPTVGDRVISTILPNWLCGPLTAQKLVGSLGGSAADGVLSEEAILKASSVVAVPEFFTNVEACTMPCAALTAWHALSRASSLRPGARILLQGTGGVSIFALQMAIAAGAESFIVSSDDQKLERAIGLGASGGANYRQNCDWPDAAAAHTAGVGFDHVLDVGGASTLSKSIELAAFEGVVSVVGLIGGLQAQLDLTPVFSKNLRIDGIEVGSHQMLAEMVMWLETKGIRPVVDSVFAFEDAKAALNRLKSGLHFGKVVIDLTA